MPAAYLAELEKAGKLGEGNEAVLSPFKDQTGISDYARESVTALIAIGVINDTDGYINPKALGHVQKFA